MVRRRPRERQRARISPSQRWPMWGQSSKAHEPRTAKHAGHGWGTVNRQAGFNRELSVPAILAVFLIVVAGCSTSAEIAAPSDVGSGREAGPQRAGETSTDTGSEPASSCAALMNFRGVRYSTLYSEDGVPVGRSLGQGVWPPCDDQPMEAPGPATTVAVSAIAGVDPAVAVVVPSWSKKEFFVVERVAEQSRSRWPQELRRLTRPNRASDQTKK